MTINVDYVSILEAHKSVFKVHLPPVANFEMTKLIHENKKPRLHLTNMRFVPIFLPPSVVAEEAAAASSSPNDNESGDYVFRPITEKVSLMLNFKKNAADVADGGLGALSCATFTTEFDKLSHENRGYLMADFNISLLANSPIHLYPPVFITWTDLLWEKNHTGGDTVLELPPVKITNVKGQIDSTASSAASKDVLNEMLTNKHQYYSFDENLAHVIYSEEANLGPLRHLLDVNPYEFPRKIQQNRAPYIRVQIHIMRGARVTSPQLKEVLAYLGFDMAELTKLGFIKTINSVPHLTFELDENRPIQAYATLTGQYDFLTCEVVPNFIHHSKIFAAELMEQTKEGSDGRVPYTIKKTRRVAPVLASKKITYEYRLQVPRFLTSISESLFTYSPWDFSNPKTIYARLKSAVKSVALEANVNVYLKFDPSTPVSAAAAVLGQHDFVQFPDLTDQEEGFGATLKGIVLLLPRRLTQLFSLSDHGIFSSATHTPVNREQDAEILLNLKEHWQTIDNFFAHNKVPIFLKCANEIDHPIWFKTIPRSHLNANCKTMGSLLSRGLEYKLIPANNWPPILDGEKVILSGQALQFYLCTLIHNEWSLFKLPFWSIVYGQLVIE